jgi:PHP family Zn ribbon phosphoesterase
MEYEDLDLKKQRKTSPNKKLIVCSKCSYKFSLDPTKFNKLTCPWCGKNQEAE